jgi:pimeloyl-ACP methyl ester carboxylesterase
MIPSLAGAIIALVVIPPGDHYWSGRVTSADRVWQLEVATGGESVWISVPSLWSPWQEAQGLSRDGRTVSFDLPAGVGRVEIGLSSDSAVAEGKFRSRDGAAGTVRLVRGEPSRSSVRSFTVGRDGIVIAGSEAVPARAGRKPAVVILHGGGDSSRVDSPPYRFWGEYFAARGYVAITYDKRGNGESTGDWRQVGFEDRAEDVLAVVRWLRQQPTVDPERVGLFAVSQGTWVAGAAAARDPRIGFVVQVSGPLVSPFEADTYAALGAWRAAGLGDGERAEAEQLWRLEVAAIRRPGAAAWDRYRQAVRDAREKSWYAKSRYAPTAPDDWFARWYRRVADFDPIPHLERVRAPVLWVYGDHDTQSDVTRNLEAIDRLRRSAPVRFEVARFAAAGHGMLAPVDSQGRALGPLATPPGFFEAVELWLARQGGQAPGRDGGDGGNE